MIFGSVCSGIEAASVAWEPLGWRAAFVAEIDPFPSAVLAHRYPETPNLGDFTAIETAPEPIGLLVGGTPCQSFSVAGLRKGMADDRGNLALEFLRLAGRLRPEWLVWENVPGVLSSNSGRDFGAFLGGLVELGYGFAYRVLDAQYVRVDGFGRAVPQRRRRVFVVGCLGDCRRAVAVLFDRESLSGNPPPGREAGAGIARCVKGSTRSGGGQSSSDGQETLIASSVSPAIVGKQHGDQIAREGHLISVGSSGSVPRTLTSRNGRLDGDAETFVASAVAGTLSPGAHPGGFNGQDAESGLLVAHTLKGEGFDGGEDGTGRGTPLIPVVCAHDTGQGWWNESDVAGTLRAEGENRPSRPSNIVAYSSEPIPINMQVATRHEALGRGTGLGVGCPGDPAYTIQAAHQHAIAFQERGRTDGRTLEYQEDLAYSLNAPNGGGRRHELNILWRWAVRRLTPLECERLQGFPDHWTDVPYRGKFASDGPRYKSIGNSMAVNAMRWIGWRISLVNANP